MELRLMCVFLIFCKLSFADTLTFQFRYNENVLADYASIFKSTREKQLLNLNTTQSGKISIAASSSNCFKAAVEFDTFFSTSMQQEETFQTLVFPFCTGKRGNAEKFFFESRQQKQITSIQNWFCDIAFVKPKEKTLHQVKKNDGVILCDYQELSSDRNEFTLLRKCSFPENESRQKMILDSSQFIVVYNSKAKRLQHLNFWKNKRQFFGRKL